MVARVPGEPGADSRVFVSGVVVNDQVHSEVGRNLRVDVAQKAQELLVSMARLALGDDAAIGHIERRKQGGGAVPIVVVGDAFDIAEPHRQHRLTALKGLNLALLVDAQHQRVFRRIQVQTDHIPHFLHEERIGRELEGLGAVRLQAEQADVAVHRTFGNARLRRQAAHRPVRRRLGLTLQSLVDQGRNPIVIVRARSSGSQFIVQSRDAVLPVSAPPETHQRYARSQLRRNLRVTHAACRQQHHSRPAHDAVGQRS